MPSPFPHSVKLSSGYEMPLVGLGTGAGAGESVNAFTEATEIALKAGYGLIDTAWYYRSEKAIGEGIRRSGVPRSKVFITSKVWPAMLHPDRVKVSVNKSLADLGTDYLDLLLVHWPFSIRVPSDKNPYDPKQIKAEYLDPSVNLIDVWRVFESLVDAKIVRTIGVSNMSVRMLKEFLPQCRIKPAVNQVELHPYLPQHELVAYCKSVGIVCTAYGPLGQDFTPKLRDDALIGEIAKKHGKSVGQVLISWAVQRGTAIVPKSTNEGRIKGNIDLFKLDDTDMKTLDTLTEQPGRRVRRYYEVWKVWGIDVFESKRQPEKYPMIGKL